MWIKIQDILQLIFTLGGLILCPMMTLAQSFPLPKDHAKTKVVEKVYRNILSVTQNEQLGNLPNIQVIKRKKNTAAYAPNSNMIKIEETAFDLCSSLGDYRDAALAILIAHEFTHFSKNHQGVNGFSCAYYDNSEELNHRTMEEEADFWGLFSAYLAGYDVLAVAPNLLAKIYEHYGFSQNMTGYPPLQIRQQLGKVALQKLENYIQLYEVGNYLTAIGSYEQAAGCYATVLQDFQSKELHNNLGVSLVRQALTIAPKGNFPFAYPLEIDVESRLYRHRTPPFGFDPQKLMTNYIQKAITQFEMALYLNSNYSSARLNLAMAHEIAGHVIDAKQQIRRLQNATLTTAQYTHLTILQGIIAAKENNHTESQQFFQNANANPIAQLNSQILNGYKPDLSQVATSSYNSFLIDGISDLRRIAQYDINIALDNQLTNDYYQPNYKFQYSLMPASVVWKVGQTRKLQQTLLQITSSPIFYTPEGLHIGSHHTEINTALGTQGIYTSTANGQFLYFPNKGFVFLLDDRNMVRQWGKVMVVGKN